MTTLSSSGALPTKQGGTSWDTFGTAPASTSAPINTQTEKLELVTASTNFQDGIVMPDKDAIKLSLVNILANELLKGDKITFTQQFDPTNNQRIFRAYTYVGSKQMVNILKGTPLSDKQKEKIYQNLLDKGLNISYSSINFVLNEAERVRNTP